MFQYPTHLHAFTPTNLSTYTREHDMNNMNMRAGALSAHGSHHSAPALPPRSLSSTGGGLPWRRRAATAARWIRALHLCRWPVCRWCSRREGPLRSDGLLPPLLIPSLSPSSIPHSPLPFSHVSLLRSAVTIGPACTGIPRRPHPVPSSPPHQT